MTAEDRESHNAARRWQYLPARIANKQRQIKAHKLALEREAAEPRRDFKRIWALQRRITDARASIRKMKAEL